MNLTFIVHYFPPINSSGAKRVESISKYLARMGHSVTVITTQKRLSDGEFTEQVPRGVNIIELNAFGRERSSQADVGTFEPMYTGAPSWKRRSKDAVMRILGQLPDPRLPFALSFATPWLAKRAKDALRRSDLVIGSTPPWVMLLAAVIAKRRFGKPVILDYRDHFSECHEMPGGRLAKWIESRVDRWLVTSADHVVTISEPMSSFYRRLAGRVTTIMNGYDHEVLDAARSAASVDAGDQIVIRYMGIVSPGRVPRRFMDALVILQREMPERFAKLRIEFYGNAALVEQTLNAEYGAIASAFGFFAAVPYLESMKLIVSSEYLLFSETSSKATLSAQGILTTKLFEYIGSGRPVIADIAPDTLAGSVLLRSGSQHVVGDTAETFLHALRDERFYERLPTHVTEASRILSRAAQADQYAGLAESVVAYNCT